MVSPFEVQFLKRISQLSLNNFYLNKKLFLLKIIPIILLILISFYTLGYGTGSLVNSLNNFSYVEYLFPGYLVLISGLLGFFESINYKKRRMESASAEYDLLTLPYTEEQFKRAELFWGVFYSSAPLCSLLVVGVISKFVSVSSLIPLLLLGLLSGLFSSYFGLWFLGFQKQPKQMIANLKIGFFLSILIGFSGIFFPVEILPAIVRTLNLFNPFLCLAEIAKAICWSQWNSVLYLYFLNLIVLLVFLNFQFRRLRIHDVNLE